MDPQRQLLSARDIYVHFPVKPGGVNGRAKRVSAVNGVSFDICRGETLGLVGESGCGKTTLGRALLRLGHGVTSGSVTFDGQDVSALDAGGFRPFRKKMQMIFQDPFGSLNPRLTVGQMLGEVLAVHRIAKGDAALRRTLELLDLVGLNREYANRYPHEFSGGQRQRVGIARALAVGPEFIICDEPVIHFGPGRGHVSRQDRRNRIFRSVVPQSPASIHTGTSFRRSHTGARCKTRQNVIERGSPWTAQCAFGMRFSPAVPGRQARVQQKGARAESIGQRSAASGELYFV